MIVLDGEVILILRTNIREKGGRSINKMLKVAQIENQDLSVYKLPKDINYSNINSDNFNLK
ncbi:hypothetical protein C2I06_21905 [Niallia circulans]|nr:hypothetical protein C2I06_21905 [Niallia circulans]